MVDLKKLTPEQARAVIGEIVVKALKDGMLNTFVVDATAPEQSGLVKIGDVQVTTADLDDVKSDGVMYLDALLGSAEAMTVDANMATTGYVELVNDLCVENEVCSKLNGNETLIEDSDRKMLATALLNALGYNLPTRTTSQDRINIRLGKVILEGLKEEKKLSTEQLQTHFVLRIAVAAGIEKIS